MLNLQEAEARSKGLTFCLASLIKNILPISTKHVKKNLSEQSLESMKTTA